MMTNNRLLEDHELMAREPDLESLRRAHALLQTNQIQAILELEKLAKAGSTMSALYLAYYFSKKPNIIFETANRWFRFAYERGSARGLYCLAVYYFEHENYSEAEKLFSDGASKNDAQSIYGLTQSYIKTGRYGVSSPEIRDLLERAAAQGHARAMRDLWLSYITGVFGIRNIPKGISLLAFFIVKAFRLSFGHQPDAYGESDRRLW